MATPQNNFPETDNSHHHARVAGGAGLAFLARLGALIELASVIIFTWAYGALTFGLFAVLWSYVKVTTSISEVAMNTALQRFVPRPELDHNVVAGYAIKLSFITACLFAGLITYFAPYLASFINAGTADSNHLVTVIRVYVWVLPFWTLVEVGTSAVRATRTFGPEIKVRVFYEQGLRLIAGVLFAGMGLYTYGLFLAHLISVILSALLALRLIAKYYDFRAVIMAPLSGTVQKEMRSYGFSVMPSNLIKMMFSEFPVVFLNMMLPGPMGAAAGGYYAIARKIASALQVIRLTFEYVMAPLVSEKEGNGDRTALESMYAYATRLSATISLPFGAAIILARPDILMTMKPEFQAAYAAIAILCAGRMIEALTGPSSAIIEMLGHRMVPLINNTLGFIVLLILGLYLIPLYGVTGAAIAAATGVSTTALLGFIETAVLFKLFPYNREAARPVLMATVLSALMLSLLPYSKYIPAPFSTVAAIIGLLLILALVVRYGLSDADSKALGKLGRVLARKQKN